MQAVAHTPPIQTPSRIFTPLRPERGTRHRFDADEFSFEGKGNGRRGILYNVSGNSHPVLYSRHGNLIDASPYMEAIDQLPGGAGWHGYLDFELMGSPRTPGVGDGSIMIIDLPCVAAPYKERHAMIRDQVDCFVEPGPDGKWPKVFRPVAVHCPTGADVLWDTLRHRRQKENFNVPL